jgi:peptidoglycan hydrolase CwlO-like protein
MQKNLKQLFGDAHGLDERSVDFLTGALEKNNLPGFDYIEYKQSLGALTAMNIDEMTAFKSAYATAATVGLTKEKLLKTAEHYKGILQQEKIQFDAALEKQMQQRVKSKQDEVVKLKKQIEDYQLKIKQMQDKIAESEAIVANADEDIRSSMEKINATRENFESTLRSIVNEIDKDVENINRYL